MRKNKFLLCLSIIIIVFFGVITVYAVSTTGDYQGGALDTSESGGGKTHYPYPYFDGIRISFVKSNGEEIVSRNYVDDAQYKNNFNTVVKTISRTCSHPSYSNGYCPFSWNLGTSIGSAASPISDLQAMFNNVTLDSGQSYSFPVNVTAKVASNSYTGIFDGLYRENNPSLSEEDYSNFIYKLFNNMLHNLGAATTVDDYVVKEEQNQLYDLFLVFEPITVVKMNHHYYMGTAYELAREARSQVAGGWENSEGEYPCKGSSEGALCDLSSILKKLIPCKSYLRGNIIDSMKEKQSTILIQNFPDGYYFNNIKIDYNNSQEVCSHSSEYLSADVVSGNYGVGIGVIWLSDVYEGDENSCASIINGITWNWQGSFETAFNASGIDGIYDMFKEQVSSEYPYGYIAYNNGAGKADLKWFINQCTCYGMYDHYAKNNIATYQAQNQSSINQISGTFGSSDWFKVPQISETKGWLINSKFNSGSFTAFNNEMQAYSDDNELKWTPWTGEYYNEVLKCGTKEEYWCEEFETWYEEMRTQYSGLRSYPTISTIKNSSLAVINARYKEQLQTMIDAYNLNFYPANGFRWTLDATDSGTNFSYIKNCISADTASCQTVINFYQQNEGTDLNNLACDRLESFDFSAYNNRYGTDITGQWFSANCGCSESTAYNCTPNYSVGSCTNNDDILYTDSSNGIINDEYWKNCVFDDIGEYDIDPHKVSDHGSDLTYYEKGLGSQYCEVYCIEDLNASLAKPNINVEAGSRLTWGYSRVEGSRTCKTKTVEWDKFEDDLEKANKDIRESYVTWQLEILKQEAINEAVFEDDSSKCDCIYNTSRFDCCRSQERYTVACPTKANPGRRCTRYRCTDRDDTRYGYYDGEGNSFSIIQGEHDSFSDSEVSWCENESRPRTYVSSYRSQYNDAVKYAQSLVDDMKACYTWDQSTVYEVDPQAKIFYSDDINYNYSDDLEKTTSYSFSDESVCEADIAEQIKGCSGESCPTTDVSMKNCSGEDHYAQMTRKATTRFLLKEGVFRYVLKSNHLSVHQGELPSGGEFTVNYIDIGFSNFPVSFSAPAGLYGTKHNMGQFDVEYSNLGHVESGKTDIDTIMSGSTISQGTGEEYGKWICEYEVYADLLPEDPDGPGGDPDGPGGDPGDNGGVGDIDLIYRPIDLHDPFPDIDASYRDTGANWCDEEDNCSYDNYSVQTYIFENRGVNYEEVYDLEPMYTFILTPSIIKEIREYNDSNSYASYTGSLGTAQHFDYVCEEGTGQACISDYLSYIIDITCAKNQPGACVADKFRNENDSESFYGCRY